MAGNNDFLAFATGGGANVVSQATYAADPLTGSGFLSGTAQSAKCNKAWRQGSFMAAMLGTFIANQNVNANDDGVVANLLTSFQSALTSYLQTLGLVPATGTVRITFQTVADASWILANDGTIGDGSSGGTTRANADTVNLFTLIWNNFSNANCPVSSGRGASAAADFAAHKTIALPKMVGRALALSGAGAGLSTHNLGDAIGAETQAIAQGNLPNISLPVNEGSGHQHALPQSTGLASGGSAGSLVIGGSGAVTSLAVTGLTVSTGGSGTAVSIIQPTSYLNAQIKL